MQIEAVYNPPCDAVELVVADAGIDGVVFFVTAQALTASNGPQLVHTVGSAIANAIEENSGKKADPDQIETLLSQAFAAYSPPWVKQMMKVSSWAQEQAQTLSAMEPDVMTVIRRMVPGITGTRMFCPQCRDGKELGWATRQASLCDIIMHLNDAHMASRESIADWLETLDVDLTIKAEA